MPSKILVKESSSTLILSDSQTTDSIHLMDISDDINPPIGTTIAGTLPFGLIQLVVAIGELDWWEHLDCLVAFEWAIQSFADPNNA